MNSAFYSQNKKLDSLKVAFNNTNFNDTARTKSMLAFGREFGKINKDSGIYYLKKVLVFIQAKILIIKNDDPATKFYIKQKGNGIFYTGYLYFLQGNFNKAEPLFEQSLTVRKGSNDKAGTAQSMAGLGGIYLSQGKTDQAFNYYKRSLKIEEELGNKKAIASLMNNMAIVYMNKGLVEKSLECHKRSLKYNEEIGNKSAIGTSLNNIGVIYHSQKQIENAIDWFKRSLKNTEEANDKKGIANALSNLAIMYQEQHKMEKALEYGRKSLRIREELGDRQGIATSLTFLGNNYSENGKFPESMDFYNQSLKIFQEIGDLQRASGVMIAIATTYLKEKKYSEALKMAEKGFKIANDIGISSEIASAAAVMKNIYSAINKPAEALKMFELYIKMRDTVNNAENQNAILKKQYEIEFNSKEREVLLMADAEKKILMQKQEADKKKSAIIVISIVFVLILVSIFSIIILKSLRENKKTNEIITKQKQLVEAKQKEVLDSIQYAKRLQDAILPANNYWKENLADSFVLYKPKDIVAGDFYWMEKIGDIILFAVGDCTGHGVPGAMVSVVCSNALNRTVLEFKITDPGKILDKTRELVISTFEKSDEEVKDGMDISLCCFNSKTKMLQWAGANNALWYIKDGKLETIKANKQPIGKFELQKPFTTNSLQLNKNDMLFLISDGYSDQFGGPKGKKFKYKQLTDMLLANLHKAVNEQKEILNKAFVDWKGLNEQVDDVCIVGVRI